VNKTKRQFKAPPELVSGNILVFNYRRFKTDQFLHRVTYSLVTIEAASTLYRRRVDRLI